MSPPRRQRISVVIPAWNASGQLRRCLAALQEGSEQPFEVIVVDDGSTDDTPEVAASFGATVLKTNGRRGPSVARNQGAAGARGEILFFIDSDVCVSKDSITRVGMHFENVGVDAVIGSYDADPASPGLISVYRNLVHHYTHQKANTEATTFWSGCGAIRRDVFMKMEGFDASYLRPAIEDIELGYRLHAAGHRILLDPELQVKHLKRWTLPNMVRTDVLDRGIPWTLLILRMGRMPNDLNVRWHQRLSVAGVGLLLVAAVGSAFLYGGHFLAPAMGMLLLIVGSFWVIESLAPDGGAIRVALVICMALLLGVCRYSHHSWIFGIVAAGYVALFAREFLSRRWLWLKRPLGLLYGGYLLVCLGLIARQLPATPLIASLLTVAMLVIALNYRFFGFLFSRIGKVAGLALIPVHMLYFAYSGLSFVAGVVINTFRSRPTRFDHST